LGDSVRIGFQEIEHTNALALVFVEELDSDMTEDIWETNRVQSMVGLPKLLECSEARGFVGVNLSAYLV
jgi:hypothetical protein